MFTNRCQERFGRVTARAASELRRWVSRILVLSLSSALLAACTADSRVSKPLSPAAEPDPQKAYLVARLVPRYFGDQMSAQAALEIECRNPDNSYRMAFFPYIEVYAIEVEPGTCRIAGYSVSSRLSEWQQSPLGLADTSTPFEVESGKVYYLGDFEADLKLLSLSPESGKRVEKWRGFLRKHASNPTDTVAEVRAHYRQFRNTEILPAFPEAAPPAPASEPPAVMLRVDGGAGPIVVAGEVIQIEGGPVDWCTDPGQVVIDMPAGTLDQCVCGDGWIQVGSMEHDQPMCALDWGDPENPPPGPDPPDPPAPPPDPNDERDPGLCIFARPESSFSPVCNAYPPDYEYVGCSARCFCKCAGNSGWAKYVRGCLACAFEAGMGANEAHKMCYEAAARLGYPIDASSATHCALICAKSDNFPIIMINDEVVDVFR